MALGLPEHARGTRACAKGIVDKSSSYNKARVIDCLDRAQTTPSWSCTQVVGGICLEELQISCGVRVAAGTTSRLTISLNSDAMRVATEATSACIRQASTTNSSGRLSRNAA